jgi:hypothetical protein
MGDERSADNIFTDNFTLIHTAQTLPKVYKALRRIGLTEKQIDDVVSEILNEGIYFREKL